jgi:hypothetical protein
MCQDLPSTEQCGWVQKLGLKMGETVPKTWMVPPWMVPPWTVQCGTVQTSCWMDLSARVCLRSENSRQTAQCGTAHLNRWKSGVQNQKARFGQEHSSCWKSGAWP